jgi:hypothetical protein
MPSEPKETEQHMVGICWLVGDRLIIDACPLGEAERVNEFETGSVRV